VTATTASSSTATTSCCSDVAVLRAVRLTAAGLVAVPALALTLSLVGTWNAPVGIALQAFSPLAVPAYVVALVLVLAPLGGKLDRRVLVPASAVILVALIASSVVVAPRWLGASTPVAAADPRLVVMTSNLRLGEADPAAVLRVVRAEDVDVLVLEEITPSLLGRLEGLGLSDLLPHHAGAAEPGARGTVVYTRDPISEVEPIGTEHRSYAFTVGGLRMFGVHPAYPFSDGWRADQQVLVDAARSEHPDVVLGDHNASLDNPPLRALLATGLRDAAESTNAGWQPTWPTSGFKNLPIPVAAIDHVLVGKDLAAIRTRVFDIPGTDHRALVADLAVRAS
jgi:endonuclease/exonuclease/phosphatase (EEP) superfamily protein YafD